MEDACLYYSFRLILGWSDVSVSIFLKIQTLYMNICWLRFDAILQAISNFRLLIPLLTFVYQADDITLKISPLLDL